MTLPTHLRLLLLAALACTAEPCGTWARLQWTPPPVEELPAGPCIAIVASHNTVLTYGEEPSCGYEGRCLTGAAEAVPNVAVFADTSVERWEQLPFPRVVQEPVGCEVHECSELLRMLLAEQRDGEGGFR